jgi:hypothetical protein
MTRSRGTRRSAGALTLIAILHVAGCTAASPSPSSTVPSGSRAPSASASVVQSTAPSAPVSAAPSTAETAAPSDEPTESLLPFVCSPVVGLAGTTPRAQITDVRVGTYDGYDRVVFEFAEGIPQVLIEAVLQPFYQDGSGLPLAVNGTAFLRVTMHGGTRVSPDGGITYTGPTTFEPGFPQLVHLLEGGDFEAVSTWYLGFNGGGCIRVLTVSGPSRLIIDIEHSP